MERLFRFQGIILQHLALYIMNEQTYGILADLVAILHIAYAGAIVIGLLLILIGYFRQWAWVRNRWFRAIHLIMIAIVVYEAWAGITCPLTVWEKNLRSLANQPFDGHGVLAKTIHQLLFFDASWWVFTAAYSACGLMIILSIFLVPPQWGRTTELISRSD